MCRRVWRACTESACERRKDAQELGNGRALPRTSTYLLQTQCVCVCILPLVFVGMCCLTCVAYRHQHKQLLHSVVLLAAPLAKRPGLAGGLLATGTLLFSGSLYTMVLTDHRKLGAVTVCFNALNEWGGRESLLMLVSL